MSIYVAPRAKAINGPGAATMTTNPPLAAGLFINSAQMMMRAYWQVAHRNPWIADAEELISGKVASTEWHLEIDGEDIEDNPDPLAQAVLALMEKPQGNLDIGRKMTRRELWHTTSRFMGLTGNAFWLMDERNVFGIPNSLLWIRPDRMTPAEDSRGNLTGWVLDQQGATVNGQQLNGIPLDIESVLQLTPPDEGHFGIGLVEAMLKKAQLVDLSDTYAGGSLASGGRLSGLITGTQQSPIPDEVFKQLIRDLRAVTEQPDAARRTTVLQGEVNWKPTGMTPVDMALVDLMKLSRDDIFGRWRAPFSLVYGGSQATGLNSGDSRKYDEASLMQGPVHDRNVVISEVVQYQMLDTIRTRQLDLVLDEPEFDDDSPRYDLVQKSLNSPLTNAERRELLGKDPTGDPAIDNAIWLPATQVLAFSAPGDTTASPTELALGRVVQTTDNPQAAITAAGDTTAKASRYFGLRTSLTALRSNLQRTQTPRIKEAVGKVLDRQRKEIARAIRLHAEHLEKEPNDTTVWWDGQKWDRALKSAMTPYLAATADNVVAHIQTVLVPKVEGKADPVSRVLDRGAARVTKINQTTKDAITALLAQAAANDLTLLQVADAIEASDFGSFDDYRAEMIARTELMDAYNGAALGSYADAGIEMVEAIDGDEDQECIDRLAGNPYTIEDADAEEDHPNGTLDWVPIDTQEAA